MTSTTYTLYTAPTVRTSYSSIPTSTITAQAVVADGFTLSQTDHAGVTTTATRTYTATGMVLVQTDGRGNATTTHTDVAVRTTAVTDAAGNTTTTAYHTNFDQPAMVTDALGNTACYQYDIRGRKTAEWGTAIQPVCYGYDSADRLTSLTTFRAGTEIISVNPASRTDGDTTTWGYHDASGMEIRKTYADGKSVTKTYDAFNRLLTETDGRGVTKTHSYEHARSLLLGTTYTNVTSPTTARAYTYNHLGQLLTVADAAGIRTFSYNTYGELAADSLLAGGKTHLVTELQDAYGRSAGYTYTKDGAVQQTVSTGYGDDGRIASAGFVHGGAQKLFTYAYLTGTHLLQTLTKPNNMSLTLSYEAQRDLLTGMVYKRSNTTVATRSYAYDTLGRPTSRSTAKDGATVNDSFGYNSRSELSTATVNNAAYSYDYDNIGNRETTQEAAESATTYESNNLNQYTAIGDFEPTYDDAGNQTLVKTSTGIWSVVYDAENRPISFTNAESATVVECTYDYMGRRATKKVTVNGAVTLHHRYLYRGYLQIACCDLTRSNHPCLWLITWDPTQAIATRPLAIQKDGTWYTYGWDLTKNICEVFGQHGYIRTNYTYSPFGQVTATGDVTQPIQWSSEHHDTELALVYYNYRHYTPTDGRWLGRDKIITNNQYIFINNHTIFSNDILGLRVVVISGGCNHNAAGLDSAPFIPMPCDGIISDAIGYAARNIGRALGTGTHDIKWSNFIDSAETKIKELKQTTFRCQEIEWWVESSSYVRRALMEGKPPYYYRNQITARAKKLGILLRWYQSKRDFENLIKKIPAWSYDNKTGNVKEVTISREESNKISTIVYYGHGQEGEISPIYPFSAVLFWDYENKFSITTTDIKDGFFNKKYFTETPYAVSYSCKSAEKAKNGISFKSAWESYFGSTLYGTHARMDYANSNYPVPSNGEAWLPGQPWKDYKGE